jgi:hypothetical protein
MLAASSKARRQALHHSPAKLSYIFLIWYGVLCLPYNTLLMYMCYLTTSLTGKAVVHLLDLVRRAVPAVQLLFAKNLLTRSFEGHQVVDPLKDAAVVSQRQHCIRAQAQPTATCLRLPRQQSVQGACGYMNNGKVMLTQLVGGVV